MASNRDIKAIMEARKAARRAIPQVDPAELVASPPEPELAAPPEATTEAAPSPVEPEPEETVKPVAPSVVAVEPEDPRTKPAPPDDIHIVTSVKLKRHQHHQLKAEKFHAGRDIQDVIETAVDEYFKKRYGRQKRG